MVNLAGEFLAQSFDVRSAFARSISPMRANPFLSLNTQVPRLYQQALNREKNKFAESILQVLKRVCKFFSCFRVNISMRTDTSKDCCGSYSLTLKFV